MFLEAAKIYKIYDLVKKELILVAEHRGLLDHLCSHFNEYIKC